MSWQQTIIVGNVGRDPELRYLQSGAAVCDFSVAVSERWTDQQSGQQREKTTWFKCSAWNKQAETLNQYIRKGSQIMVIGTVEARAYLDKNNQPASSLDLRVRDFRFIGSRQDSMQQGGAGGGNQQYDFAPPPDNMNEIPF
jgi:single-strand DNA-binding protein